METSVLKNCLKQLKTLRDAKYSQLDASVRHEFDEIIRELEIASESEAREVSVGPTAKRALKLIGSVVEVTTNLADLVKAFFGD